MRTNTAPRVIRDRLSPGKALAVQLGLAFAAWCVIYGIGEFIAWVVHR